MVALSEKSLTDKVLAGERISAGEALELYRRPLAELGQLADARRDLAKAKSYDGHGREIVALRCVEANGGFAIECDVYPANGLRVEPLRPGPYRFGTRADADAFIAEAVKALEYLGCEIS